MAWSQRLIREQKHWLVLWKLRTQRRRRKSSMVNINALRKWTETHRITSQVMEDSNYLRNYNVIQFNRLRNNCKFCLSKLQAHTVTGRGMGGCAGMIHLQEHTHLKTAQTTSRTSTLQVKAKRNIDLTAWITTRFFQSDAVHVYMTIYHGLLFVVKSQEHYKALKWNVLASWWLLSNIVSYYFRKGHQILWWNWELVSTSCVKQDMVQLHSLQCPHYEQVKGRNTWLTAWTVYFDYRWKRTHLIPFADY